MGSHGVSLAPVTFEECPIEISNVLGGFKTEGSAIIESSSKHLLIDSTARLIGASRRILEQCLDFIQTRVRKNIVGQLAQETGVKLKIGQLLTNWEAAKRNLERVLD